MQFSSGLPAGFLGTPTVPPANLDWTIWEWASPTTTVYQWNLAVQQELASHLSLTASYVGSSTNYIIAGSTGMAPLPARRRRSSAPPIPQWNGIDLWTPFGASNYHGFNAQLDRRFQRGLYFDGGLHLGSLDR